MCVCVCLRRLRQIDKVKTTFPFDIFEFIRQFRLQSNFINEANHIIENDDIDNEQLAIINDYVKYLRSLST